ncbi:hypothetical protein ACFY7A_30095 [Streptomyces longwoodensis]|uniref:hypothetical protein n=1 Tax=Streptomyces longwoodensis TaxID=68231 RepID=UPI00367EADE3
MTDTPKTEDPMLAALLRERAGYAGRKGMEDRVAAVDEQLRLRGYSPDGERTAAADTTDGATGEAAGLVGSSSEGDTSGDASAVTGGIPTPDAVARAEAPKGRRAQGKTTT